MFSIAFLLMAPFCFQDCSYINTGYQYSNNFNETIADEGESEEEETNQEEGKSVLISAKKKKGNIISVSTNALDDSDNYNDDDDSDIKKNNIYENELADMHLQQLYINIGNDLYSNR